MVRGILIFAILLVSTPSWGTPEYRFVMEFSKREVYVGEPVSVQFNVYTNEEVVEVEVAKFPEFRGFWKENMSLRQGPIPTSSLLDPGGRLSKSPRTVPNRNSALVGSYYLVPILSSKDNHIDAMKINLAFPSQRRVGGSQPPLFVFSEGTPLVIKPLPPLPDSIPKELFFGAVGKFTFYATDPQLSFIPGEPITLRYQLQGHGNFQDLNEIPVPIPPGLEVVSKRSFTNGGIQYTNKIYEITVIPKNDAPLTIEPGALAFFDFEAAKYVVIKSAPIQLNPSHDLIKENIDSLVEWHGPDTSLQAFKPWTARPRALALAAGQFAMALMLLLVANQNRIRKPTKQPKARRKTNYLQEAAQYNKEGNERELLRYLDEALFRALCSHAQVSPALCTRAELLRRLKTVFPEEKLDLFRTIFESREQLDYSPTPPATIPRESLIEIFRTALHACQSPSKLEK